MKNNIFCETYKEHSTIVIEISKHKVVSHTELFGLDPCFRELADYAASETDRVVPMSSETYAVYYLFVRTDDLQGTYAALGELEELFRDPSFYKGTLIYMDRLVHDVYGLGEQILAKAGTSYIYRDGERTASVTSPKRGGERFAVKYSLRGMYEYCKRRIMGQDEQLKKALYLIDSFVVNMSQYDSTADTPSFFLTAPSGSGKTELYRAVKEFFRRKNIPVPVVNVDTTQITPAGYKGSSISVIADAILSERNYGKSRCAICFLDEADKKMMPDRSSDSCDDFNAMAQTNLLRLLEGCDLAAEKARCSGSDFFDEEDEVITKVDTTRVLFILMGSFQEIRDRRCDSRRPAGFGSSLPERESKAFAADVTLDDMIGAGMLEEIAGRVSRVINFRPLSRSDMRELLLAKAEKLGAERNAEIRLTDRALEELIPTAYTRLGIRKPMNILGELIDDALSEAAFDGLLQEEGESEVLIRSLTDAVFRKRRFKLPEEREAG